MVLGMIHAGVNGYILKGEDPETIHEAILEVMKGKSWLSKPVYEKISAINGGKSEIYGGIKFTKRECIVLRLLAAGLSNNEIGQKFGLSESTVGFHLKNIYARLGVGSRLEAGVWAKQHGLE